MRNVHTSFSMTCRCTLHITLPPKASPCELTFEMKWFAQSFKLFSVYFLFKILFYNHREICYCLIKFFFLPVKPFETGDDVRINLNYCKISFLKWCDEIKSNSRSMHLINLHFTRKSAWAWINQRAVSQPVSMSRVCVYSLWNATLLSEVI